jgi:hypothetical protein
LGTGETTLGPGIGLAVDIKEGILLLETEPGLKAFCLLHDLLGVMAVVSLVGGAVVVVAFCEDEDVVAATERVREDCDGTQKDIRVVAGGLVGGRAIEIPGAELADVGDLFAHGGRLRAETAIAVDPDV